MQLKAGIKWQVTSMRVTPADGVIKSDAPLCVPCRRISWNGAMSIFDKNVDWKMRQSIWLEWEECRMYYVLLKIGQQANNPTFRGWTICRTNVELNNHGIEWMGRTKLEREGQKTRDCSVVNFLCLYRNSKRHLLMLLADAQDKKCFIYSWLSVCWCHIFCIMLMTCTVHRFVHSK